LPDSGREARMRCRPRLVGTQVGILLLGTKTRHGDEPGLIALASLCLTCRDKIFSVRLCHGRQDFARQKHTNKQTKKPTTVTRPLVCPTPQETTMNIKCHAPQECLGANMPCKQLQSACVRARCMRVDSPCCSCSWRGCGETPSCLKTTTDARSPRELPQTLSAPASATPRGEAKLRRSVCPSRLATVA